ncbi:MAG TPA: molybdenum cofactor biosynthesis protein B [Stenotrophobium sp.]|jgi:molybdenum cofactor biosynthesis protein B|nr:molybdenum cofactor biosynthesis protein B [Stenotrophobium sp.]
MSKDFLALRISVLTISDTRTLTNDRSGDTLIERFTQVGHQLAERAIAPDNIYRIRATVSNWIVDDKTQVILTTGGTGVTGRDGTPEAIAPLLDKELIGFGELFRAVSFKRIGSSSMQSRCLAGVANGKYIFCVPGSVDACETAWDELLATQLDARFEPCNFATLVPRLTER